MSGVVRATGQLAGRLRGRSARLAVMVAVALAVLSVLVVSMAPASAGHHSPGASGTAVGQTGPDPGIAREFAPRPAPRRAVTWSESA